MLAANGREPGEPALNIGSHSATRFFSQDDDLWRIGHTRAGYVSRIDKEGVQGWKLLHFSRIEDADRGIDWSRMVSFAYFSFSWP